MISELEKLEEVKIILENNKIEDEGVIYLAEIKFDKLKKLKSFQLNLNNNHINYYGAATLISKLSDLENKEVKLSLTNHLMDKEETKEIRRIARNVELEM